MKQRANAVRGRLKVGDVVQITLSGEVVSKGDNKTLTLERVEAKVHAKEPPLHKLVRKIFQMENWCKESGIIVLKNVDAKFVSLGWALGTF